jgi:hypothetical protein
MWQSMEQAAPQLGIEVTRIGDPSTLGGAIIYGELLATYVGRDPGAQKFWDPVCASAP